MNSSNLFGTSLMRTVISRATVLSLLLVLIFVWPVLGATYYVSNSGSDRNPGTQKQPWANCPGMDAWRGIIALSNGDTVYFDHEGTWIGRPHGGTGHGALHITTSGVTYDGTTWGTGSTKIRATIGSTSNRTGVVFIVASDIVLSGFDIDGRRTNGGGIYVLYNQAVIVGSQANIAIDNCIVHDIGADDTFQYGILIGPVGPYTLSNVSITNTVVHDTMHEGIAIYPSWTAGGRARNNTILIRGCTVYNTGMARTDRGFGQGTSVANDSDNVTIEYNHYYNNQYGLYLTSGSHQAVGSAQNYIARYNIIHDNVVAGIATFVDPQYSYPANYTASYYGNILYNNGKMWPGNQAADIMIAYGNYKGSVLNFFNNTIYSTTNKCAFRYGVWVSNSGPITGAPTINFKNNIVYTENYPAVYDPKVLLTHSNNLIFRSSGVADTHVASPPATNFNRAGVKKWEPSAKNTKPIFAGGNLPTGFVKTNTTGMIPNTNYFAITSGDALNNGITLGSPYNGCINAAGATVSVCRPAGGYDIGAYQRHK